MIWLAGRAATSATWSLLEAVGDEAPLGNMAIPPSPPTTPPCLILSVKRTSLYVGGWYTKLRRYSRVLSVFVLGRIGNLELLQRTANLPQASLCHAKRKER